MVDLLFKGAIFQDMMLFFLIEGIIVNHTFEVHDKYHTPSSSILYVWECKYDGLPKQSYKACPFYR